MAPDIFRYLSTWVSDTGETVSFEYQIEHAGERYDLTETLKFPLPLPQTLEMSAAIRALHLALGVSYYKTFVSQTIEQPYRMDQAEADFWNDVWRHGLGEFLFVNKLPASSLAKFAAQSTGTEPEGLSESPARSAAIMGIGGGKDSIVAGELLKSSGVAVEGFVMATGEQRGQAQSVADTMGVVLQAVERRLDGQLLELQERPDGHKGHVPISLIFGLVGTVLALASGNKYVVVANEASASIPRVTWQDESVNHQWSKSFGFEQQLQRYIHERICGDVTYFSAVRELTSVGVAKLFAQYPAYFEVFTSDNFVFRIDPTRRPNGRWSLESPKSLSSFMLLSPWIDESEMLRIFGRDFLNERELESLFMELTGLQGHPPLDCVGTVDELVLSINLAAQQSKWQDSYLMQLAKDRSLVHDDDWQTKLDDMLALQGEQALPLELRDVLTQRLLEGLQA